MLNLKEKLISFNNYKAAIFYLILPATKIKIMRRGFIGLVLFSVIAGTVQAQGTKSVYFELGGPGLASFNFDTRFSGRPDGIGGRVGVGGFYIADEGVIFFPIGVNYLIGKDNKHYFEVGGG